MAVHWIQYNFPNIFSQIRTAVQSSYMNLKKKKLIWKKNPFLYWDQKVEVFYLYEYPQVISYFTVHTSKDQKI